MGMNVDEGEDDRLVGLYTKNGDSVLTLYYMRVFS